MWQFAIHILGRNSGKACFISLQSISIHSGGAGHRAGAPGGTAVAWELLWYPTQTPPPLWIVLFSVARLSFDTLLQLK